MSTFTQASDAPLVASRPAARDARELLGRVMGYVGGRRD